MKNNDYANAIGAFFLLQRLHKGVTREEVGKAMGKSETWCYDIENARIQIKYEDADKLCKYYGASIINLNSFINYSNSDILNGPDSTYDLFGDNFIPQAPINFEVTPLGKNLCPLCDVETEYYENKNKELNRPDKVSFQQNLASFLRISRKKCGLSRDKAAEMLGRSRNWLAKIETCKGNPSNYDLFRLLDLYEVDILELCKLYAERGE